MRKNPRHPCRGFLSCHSVPVILVSLFILWYNMCAMKTDKNELLVLMGAPGAGKGTFARLLRQHCEFNYIETGAILREMPADSEIGRLIARGDFVPDKYLFDLMQSKITPDRDVLLDGFPRTLTQAKWLVDTYADKFNVHVMYLNVPHDVILERLHRRLNAGSARADDNDATVVQHRLDKFNETTMPAIDWLRTAGGIHFSDVDVSADAAEDNFVNILAALD